MDTIEHHFWGLGVHMVHVFTDLGFLIGLFAVNLPIILVTFIPLTWRLNRMEKWIKPCMKEMQFLER